MHTLHVMGRTSLRHVLVVCGAGIEGSRARAELALERFRTLQRGNLDVVFALMGGTSDSNPFPPHQMEYQVMLDYLVSQGVNQQIIYTDGQHGKPSGTTYQNVLFAIRKGFIVPTNVLYFFCADLQEYPIRCALEWERFTQPAHEHFVFSAEKYSKLHGLVYYVTALLSFGRLEVAVKAERLFTIPYWLYQWAKALGGLRMQRA